MKTRWKILITIALAILTVWLQSYFQNPKPKECATTPVMNNAELHAWYDAYNKKYFDSKLTGEVFFVWVNMHERLRMGETECNEDVCIIRLDPTYNEAFPIAKLTLLHEMCHKAEYGTEFDSHGPKWHACMDSLYKKGAFEGLL